MGSGDAQQEGQLAGGKPAPLTIINDSFWNVLSAPKCRVGEGPEFQPFDSAGLVSKRLWHTTAACEDSLALLHRCNRLRRLGWWLNALGLGLVIVFQLGLLMMPRTVPARPSAFQEQIRAVLLLAPLFSIGYGMFVRHDAYRCFQEAIEVYNRSVGATPAQEEH